MGSYSRIVCYLSMIYIYKYWLLGEEGKGGYYLIVRNMLEWCGSGVPKGYGRRWRWLNFERVFIRR